MSKDSLEQLLRQADRMAGRPDKVYVNLSEIHRRIKRRRFVGIGGPIAVAAVFMIALGIWIAKPGTPHASPEKQRIASLENQVQQLQARTDATMRLIQEMLEQEQSLQNVEKLYKSGRASSADLANAQEKLARSKIEIIERREQLSKSAGGDIIESLNSKLADYSINTTQNKVKLQRLQQQLVELEDLLKIADDYEMLSLKADIAKQNLREALLWRDRMTRQVRIIQPPTVTVIGE